MADVACWILQQKKRSVVDSNDNWTETMVMMCCMMRAKVKQVSLIMILTALIRRFYIQQQLIICQAMETVANLHLRFDGSVTLSTCIVRKAICESLAD